MMKTLGYATAAYTCYQLYNYYSKAPKPEVPMLLDLSEIKGDGADANLINIFIWADREYIGRIACVCKKWKALTDSAVFYKLMWEKHASEVFGEREWIRYYGYPGAVNEIPERLKKLYCRFPSALIWKPEAIRRPGENQPRPYDIRRIAEWSADPSPESEGHAVNFHPHSWQKPLESTQEKGKGEWHLISTNRIPERYSRDHEWKAQQLSKGEVGSSRDVCLLLFTEKVRNGVSLFAPNPETQQINRVRTSEKIKWTNTWTSFDGIEISKCHSFVTVTFTPEGVRICSDREETNRDNRGYLIVWKEEPSKPRIRTTKFEVMTWG